MPHKNTRRRRANDGYQSKVETWTKHLNDALKGEGRYSVERCEESLAYFKGKRAAYLANKAQSDAPMMPRPEGAEERALQACRAAFEGLSESERLMKANRTIKDAAEMGISVNQTMAFLQKAGVMSDTELMHATQF
jgi:hypothetical protein